MPGRAARICSCGKVVPSGATCPCQAARKRARGKAHDQKRGSAAQRLYDGEWRKASKAFLARHPYCARCGKPLDLTKPRSAVVDHKIPHKRDLRLFWDQDNWTRLCTPCHSGAKQREERRFYGKSQP